MKLRNEYREVANFGTCVNGRITMNIANGPTYVSSEYAFAEEDIDKLLTFLYTNTEAGKKRIDKVTYKEPQLSEL